MSTTLNDRVPRIYVGLARSLRNQVRDASGQFKLATDAIWLPLKARYQTHGKAPNELLDAAQRNWT